MKNWLTTVVLLPLMSACGNAPVPSQPQGNMTAAKKTDTTAPQVPAEKNAASVPNVGAPAKGNTGANPVGAAALSQPSNNSSTATMAAAIGSLNATNTANKYSALLAQGFQLNTDFDGDKVNDVVWFDPTSGSIVVWYLSKTVEQGVTRIATKYTSTMTLKVPGGVWRLSGAADFNGDGIPDLMWHNPSSGQILAWILKRVTVNGAVSVDYDRSENLLTAAGTPQLLADPNWHIVGIGDFNGDKKHDLAWQNPVTGEIAVWLLNGLKVLEGKMIGNVGASAWRIVGVADMNFDGISDLIWRNPTQTTDDFTVWFLDKAMQKPLPGSETVSGCNIDPQAPAACAMLSKPLGNGTSEYRRDFVGTILDIDEDGYPEVIWRSAAAELVNQVQVYVSNVLLKKIVPGSVFGNGLNPWFEPPALDKSTGLPNIADNNWRLAAPGSSESLQVVKFVK